MSWIYRPRGFWNLVDMDPTDLAVVVAGDICEGRINVFDYIPYRFDYTRLTYLRFCLLAGCKIDDIKYLSCEELKVLLLKLMKEGTGDFDENDKYALGSRLLLLMYPFSQWGSGCYYIDHTTLNLSENMTLDEIKILLQSEFEFDYFKPWGKDCAQIWHIPQMGETMD